ncbi:MAG TPA: S9 family peptidase [Thermomicrobiales bacterium]|nr:S9 family peptidase [Thermomicrobiales bacterium]
MDTQPNGGAGPLNPEEIADRIVPGEPRILPDGRAVVFEAAPAGAPGKHPAQAIWIGREDGEPRRLTQGTAHDHSPRPAPDGRRLAFLSDRAARAAETDPKRDEPYDSALYLLDLAGGEAQRLGDLDGKLSQPEWSPDGGAIALLRIDPETAEEKRRKDDLDDRIIADENPKWSRLWLVDVASGKARCLTTADRQVWSFAWTPDGESLVVLTTEESELDRHFGPNDLWAIPRSGGLNRFIANVHGEPSSPVVVDGADGPLVVVAKNQGWQSPPESVWTIPLAGGEERNVSPELAGNVEAIVPWPGAPGRVAAIVAERLHAGVFGVDLDAGTMSPLAPKAIAGKGSVAAASLSADGKRIALAWSDAVTPEEIWLGATAGKGTAVTCFGHAFRGRLQPFETVRWTSADGVEVEGMLTLPAGYEPGKRCPLVVQIHGGPFWRWDDRVMLDWHDWAQLLASRGIAVLLPNPRGSTAYGAAHQALLQDDVGGGEAQDLISGAQAMVERGIADPDRLGIGGWSWGGYLTAWTITQTDIFRAAVMGAGLANMVSDHGQDDIPSMNLLIYPGQPYEHPEAYWQASPIRHAANIKTPTLILHGDADARVHPAQGMEYHRALKTLGVPVEFVRYPREGHPIKERAHQIDLMRRVAAWCRRWLVDEPARRQDGESPS